MNKTKKKNRKKVDTVKSVNNSIRTSVRKLNPILKSIVGKKVDVAIRDLQFSAKRISKDIRKTISSAVANAENNFQYDIDNLVVKEAYCGKKIVMKRFRPRARSMPTSSSLIPTPSSRGWLMVRAPMPMPIAISIPVAIIKSMSTSMRMPV